MKNNEQGIYTIFTAMILVALMFVLGLAIDSGKLQVDRARLQRAADAGAVVGGSRIGDIDKANVEKLGLLVAQDNMKLHNIYFDAGSIGKYITSKMLTSNDLQVNTDTTTSTFFIGKVVGGTPDWKLSTVAAAKKRPVAVTLVMDVSGSMDEVVSKGQTRLSLLKSAAKTFVNSFDENKDSFALVSYSNDATVNYPLSKPFSKSDIGKIIDGLTSKESTNTHSGIVAARKELSKVESVIGPGYDAFQKTIVLITDGAPNKNSGTVYPAGCPKDQNKPDLVLPILEADAARAENTLVFGIGIGKPDTLLNTAFQTQPTSSGAGSTLLKQIMFRRFVNEAASGSKDSQFPSSCLPSFKDIADKPVGRYLESADAKDITYMLNEVSLEIQMKLTK